MTFGFYGLTYILITFSNPVVAGLEKCVAVVPFSFKNRNW
jgi:hypothetical protein